MTKSIKFLLVFLLSNISFIFSQDAPEDFQYNQSRFQAFYLFLDADIDDIYQLQLQFENGMMGNLIVEVFSQPAVNLIRVAGTEGTIEFDQHENKFRLYKTEEEKWVQIELNKGLAEEGYLYAEEPYVEEMKDFISGILGEKQYPYTFADDLKILNQLQKAEQSADQGSHIKTSLNLQ